MPVSPTQTRPPGGAAGLPAEAVVARLAGARERTLALVAPVSDADLERQHHPLMSPLVWDLAHIAAYEDLWICGRVGGLEPLRPDLMALYDAFETPRPARGSAPLLAARGARDYLAAVRERALAVLERSAAAATRGAYLCEMVLRHELQHTETMLQALNLAPAGTFCPERLPAAPAGAAAAPAGTVLVERATVPVGASAGFAYDNERPRHVVELPAFRIDRRPVTNGEFAEFVADGGYGRRELWSPAGWRWRVETGAERPLTWTADGGLRAFERVGPLERQLPVMHVCFHEAAAFARWRGARLPTEAEWEVAATHDPSGGGTLPLPWGEGPATPERANLDARAFGPAPAGALAAGAAPCGALGLIGDVWEWTASPFAPYPGFRAHPYREYSEVHFGRGHRVLRGGSWATAPRVATATLRNWDLPERRQIFAGFRCAEDA